MKKSIIILLLFHIVAFAQVGVNTTAPKAALDVESTTNGILIPRVQLSSIFDITTIVNPNSGPLETSTLVYNRNPAGLAPNDVVSGFYYWNNTAVPPQWIPVARGTNWNLFGNNAITNPAIPSTYGASTFGATENFIGTIDNNDFTIGTNNIERMRVKNTTGNIGIGLSNPTEKLHVFTNSSNNHSSIFGDALQLSTGVTDYENIGVKGIGRGTSGWGFVNGVMGIGDITNSYYATGIYAHLGSATPALPSFNQALYANGNTLGNAGIFMGGNVGIGTENPVTNTEITSSRITELRLSSTAGFGASRFSMVSDRGTINQWRPAYLENADNGTFTGRLDFYTNGTGTTNKFGSVRAMSVTNGSVGIGTTTPNLARLQVDGMIGNTTAVFRGNSTTSIGISMVADWPGIYFNSYYNGAIRSMTGAGYASIINTDQANGGLIFQTTNVVNPASGSTIASVPTRMIIAGDGNVGIGAPTPSNLLHINSTTNGAVRIVDGTQATGRVLTSNAMGVGTWQPVGISNVTGVLSATGVSIEYNRSNYLQTGSYIILPPGKYAVNVTMLLARNTTIYASPNNSFFWVRSTFSDSSAFFPAASPDIVGSTLASGNFPGSSIYALLTGTIIINNATGANKTYYYVAGNTVNNSATTETLTNFGSSYWAEDNIIAYRLN